MWNLCGMMACLVRVRHFEAHRVSNSLDIEFVVVGNQAEGFAAYLFTSREDDYFLGVTLVHNYSLRRGQFFRC